MVNIFLRVHHPLKIAAANVFNTISTNIGLRRQFAMLKSIRMTGRLPAHDEPECLLYGFKGLVYGIGRDRGDLPDLPGRGPGTRSVLHSLVQPGNRHRQRVRGHVPFMIYAMNKIRKDSWSTRCETNL